jgi:amidase
MIGLIIPQKYHLSYSVQPDPFTISPGESINISLVDAHGYDKSMTQVAGSPNPLAGPFFVPHASPGQALAVTIEEIDNNRSLGWANKNIHPNLYVPGNRPENNLKEYVKWEIHNKNNTLCPLDGYFPKGKVAIPIQNMLGCIGVAEGLNSNISSILSGSFGGNMDYSRIRAGTTLYLPIMVEGGYLYLGDGHAVQGEGEITGNGVEISCDVRFHIQIEEMKLRFPRGEDREFLFCIGISSNLENAIRIATEEMGIWLRERYNLSKDQCGILMGQLVKYEIGNFVSPEYSASCLMPKVIIERLI